MLNNYYISFLPSRKIEMSKLNVFAVFGIVFLSSVLLGSGTFVSNQTSILAQENEVEVEVDIEQENKCKKDTDCENENEINNTLNITNITQKQQQTEESIGPEPETCQECFYKFLTNNLMRYLVLPILWNVFVHFYLILAQVNQ